MVDKAKKSPLPEKTGQGQKRHQPAAERTSADPTFVRGIIEPTTKKGS